MICTGTPNHCQCHGHCPMAGVRREDCVPMNNAARRAQGMPEVPGETIDSMIDDMVARLFGPTP